MNSPLRLDAESLKDEARRIRLRLVEGVRTLAAVGEVDYGATAREAVWRDGKVVLYRFRGSRPPSARVPLLMVYALVNRPYMVDLQADRSLVRRLLEAGEDVYLLDWGYPDRSDRYLTLEDYLLGYLDAAVRVLCRQAGVPAIDLMGICQGGVFSLCYASLRRPCVRNLLTMVTPVDFHTADNLLGLWARALDPDLMVQALGNIPADLMNASYLMLKPFRLNLQKYVGLLDILDDQRAVEDFLRMEKWIFDSPDLAGAAFSEFVKTFYQGNGFVTGRVRVGDRAVDLRRLDMPILNLYAEQDHLVPPAASRALAGLVSSHDYAELGFRGGHIGIYVSARAQREVPPAIHAWLRAHDD